MTVYLVYNKGLVVIYRTKEAAERRVQEIHTAQGDCRAYYDTWVVSENEDGA